ncbi:OxaA/YidC-like membrane insertion protein [Actinidia rufa]|uniref:OxaA/YidC-like membrane insertion protein n=1 Tax=Actinidia rufa TaxID=165716 RepID=A0A7J0HDQ2_9ERIC|nr:OxaA/YidC-like membrane insertion protein [Actinidia rufa]
MKGHNAQNTVKKIDIEVLKDGLSALHVPYAYGFAIILLTTLVKAATFPLTKKQEKIHLEAARLYKLAGVNPLAGWSSSPWMIRYLGISRLACIARSLTVTNNILSTVQQVWLLKLGGRQNPATKFSDTIIKEKPSQIQSSIIESNTTDLKKSIEITTIKEPQGEKLTSIGFRPGERFKEARGKKKTEERGREEES